MDRFAIKYGDKYYEFVGIPVESTGYIRHNCEKCCFTQSCPMFNLRCSSLAPLLMITGYRWEEIGGD